MQGSRVCNAKSAGVKNMLCTKCRIKNKYCKDCRVQEHVTHRMQGSGVCDTTNAVVNAEFRNT